MAGKRTRDFPKSPRGGKETPHNLTRAPLISWGCTKHKSKVDEEVEANDSKPTVTSSTKESSGTSLPVKSDDGTLNAKKVEGKKTSPKVSNCQILSVCQTHLHLIHQ
mmetsp:Transcript_24347/g.37225  ORF Transcript_24347/g.37225 Transcript_24347/m.37225 type:complete len:107 (+) Transcript_24347:162-482(+)